MNSPWSGVGMDFLSEGEWAIGQGPNAPDRQLFRSLLRMYLDRRDALGDPTLIEVGFGSGIDVRELVRVGLLGSVEYRGYDLTPEFVAALRRDFHGLSFEQLDIVNPRSIEAAEFVWCRHVLEHVEDGYQALANLWRMTNEVLLVSWFIRPTWSEAEVGCGVADGFLHWTYSARRMIEFKRELGAHLYRFDIDHHLNKASVWMFTREKCPELAEQAHRFLQSPEFLRNVLSVPPREQDAKEALLDVVTDAAYSISMLDEIVVSAVSGPGTCVVKNPEGARVDAKQARKIRDVCLAARYGNRPLERYDRFVFWGFDSSMDSMRHIFRHFIHALETDSRETLWVPNAEASLELLEPGSLVFGVDVEGTHLRARPGVDYVLHNFDASHEVWEDLEQQRFIRLQTYTNESERYGEMWDLVRRYDAEAKTLFQPWGTDLLVEEFMEPVFNGDSREAWFVGAVWDDGGLGNVHMISELELVLSERDLELCFLTQVSDEENVGAVRNSRIAPAFTGNWQVENNYLPCRVFKNVSYGQVAMTNVPKFREIFAGCSLVDGTLAEVIDDALSLPDRDYRDLVLTQQQIVQRYTYRESLAAIGRALEEGK